MHDLRATFTSDMKIENVHGRNESRPEYGLWAAVITVAASDVALGDDSESRKAMNWAMYKDTRCARIGSLDWICDMLNIDAGRVRSNFMAKWAIRKAAGNEAVAGILEKITRKKLVPA